MHAKSSESVRYYAKVSVMQQNKCLTSICRGAGRFIRPTEAVKSHVSQSAAVMPPRALPSSKPRTAAEKWKAWLLSEYKDEQKLSANLVR